VIQVLDILLAPNPGADAALRTMPKTRKKELMVITTRARLAFATSHIFSNPPSAKDLFEVLDTPRLPVSEYPPYFLWATDMEVLARDSDCVSVLGQTSLKHRISARSRAF